MTENQKYWIVPREKNSLYDKKTNDFERFLQLNGYLLKDEPTEQHVYCDEGTIARRPKDKDWFFIDIENIESGELNPKKIEYVLDFINILKANNIEFNERFDRSTLTKKLTESKETLEKLIQKLNIRTDY